MSNKQIQAEPRETATVAAEAVSGAKRGASLSVIAWLIYGSFCLARLWLPAGLSGCAIMVLVVAGEYRRRAVRIMDCTSLGYFALAAVMAATPAIHILQKYHVVIVWGIFAIVTWATVAVGFPFTIQYAREQAPRETWDSPRFRRTNLILTMMWGVIFTFGAILGMGILVDGHPFLLGVVIPMIAMGAGYIFSYEYPKRASDRFESIAVTSRRA